jgi:hypothetical protein
MHLLRLVARGGLLNRELAFHSLIRGEFVCQLNEY